MRAMFSLIMKRARWRLGLGVLLGLAAGSLQMFVLRALQNQIAASSGGHAQTVLMATIALFVGGIVVRLMFSFVSGSIIHTIAVATVMQLRLDLAARLTAVPLIDFEQLGAPLVHHILADEIYFVGEGITVIPTLLLNAALLLASIAYLAWLSMVTLGLALVGMCAALCVVRVGSRLAKSRTVALAACQADLQQQMEGIIDGGKELRTHEEKRLQFLGSELGGAVERTRLSSIRGGSTERIVQSATLLVIWATVGLVLFVGPRLGGADASTAVVVLFLLTPFGEVTGSWGVVMRGSFAYERIQRVVRGMANDPPMSGSSGHDDVPAFTRQITLRAVEHVYFGDRGDRFRLGPLDLSLRRGELLFLVGGNGSGKTTLAKLLVGFYAPMTGDLLLDDQPLDGDRSRARYRQLFSTIFSSFYVFPWIVDPSPAREDMARHLLAELGLEEIVKVQDGRFVTTQMSTGQKKRFALACALLDDRPIYLFDEWAADQDPVWKQLFYKELLPKLKANGKTVIVVTHDDRYFDCADRVVKMESGRIVTDGPPSV